MENEEAEPGEVQEAVRAAGTIVLAEALCLRRERIEKEPVEVTDLLRGYRKTVFHEGQPGMGKLQRRGQSCVWVKFPKLCRVKVAGEALILFTKLKGYAHSG